MHRNAEDKLWQDKMCWIGQSPDLRSEWASALRSRRFGRKEHIPCSQIAMQDVMHMHMLQTRSNIPDGLKDDFHLGHAFALLHRRGLQLLVEESNLNAVLLDNLTS